MSKLLVASRIDMILFIGVLLLISGFITPFLGKGEIPSVIFWWMGFLVLFSSRKHYPRQALWMKWGRYGVLTNAFGTLALIEVIEILALSNKYNILSIVLKGNYILSPISTAVKYLFRHLRVESTDGIGTFAVSYFRSTATSFLDVLVFIGLGILVGKLSIKKHNNDGIITENN